MRLGARVMRYFQLISLFVAIAGLMLAMSNLQITDPAEAVSFVRIVMFLFLLIATLLAISIWMLSRRNLAKRIDRLSLTLERVSRGDLTARIEAADVDEMDQLANNLNMMLDKFENLIIGINSIAAELTAISLKNGEAVGKVLGAARIQSEGVDKTSSAVYGIISSVENVGAGVKNLTKSAEINIASIREITTSISEVRNNITIQSGSIDEVSSSIIEMTAVMEEISLNVRSLMEASVNTTSSIAEMDASNKQVEENARETATISAEVMKDAELGKTAVEATITGIGEIRNSSRSTFSSINTLSERVSAIGSILSVIDEIAEQTNLLALNSAIIAAQAGEHGKGFAIVAGEIKGLANRTRQSTMEIAALIEAVQEETAKAVSAIRLTEEKVSEGDHLSRRSGDALGKIVAGVQMSSARVNEIARATVEQAKGGQSIHGSMRHVADMVAQIARSCQESARTNSSIMMAVERMKKLTSQVNTSAANQQQIGEDIANSNEMMGSDIGNIEAACKEQSDWSMQIVQSVDNVRESTQINLESAQIMEIGVESLLVQIDMLRKEINDLQISDKGKVQ